MNLTALYTTQLRVLWEWRGGRKALLKRLLITLVVSTIAFLLTAWLLPGIQIDRVLDGVIVVIAMAVLNALVRPLVLAIVAPRSLILTGIAVLLLQVLVFLFAASFEPGVHVNGFLTAFVGSFVYAIINTILTAILGIDSGDSFYGLLIQNLLLKRAAAKSDQPGLVIVQIDGLAHPILAGRMRAGSVNTMSSWVRNGTHRLERWEAILPSMTSASQAGILHGNNDGIPAFRWYERDRQHLMVSSNPVDAGEIVRRVSNGEGLLSNNGASICNLVTGDATRAYLTTAAIKDERQGIGDSKAFLGFFMSPSGYLAVVHAVPRRVHQGAHPGAADAPFRDPAADAPRPEVRGHAGREQRPAARRQRLADHRGDVPRDQRDLRGLHRLRRARPPLRARAGRVVRGARRRRSRDRRRSRRRRGTRRGRTSSSSSPTTARASAPRSSSATARAWARSSST